MLKRLILLVGLLASATLMTPQGASALPPGCPSPIHPCACPTPCPVIDTGFIGTAKRIQSYFDSATKAYGITDIPRDIQSSAASAEQIANAGILGTRSILESSLIGAEGNVNNSAFGQALSVHLPEHELMEEQIAGASAITREPGSQSVESINGARSRLEGRFYGPAGMTSQEIASLLEKRHQNLRNTSLIAYARALVERNRISSIDMAAVGEMEAQVDRSATLSQDLRANSQFARMLYESMATTTDLTAEVLALREARQLSNDTEVISPNAPVNPTHVIDPEKQQKIDAERQALIRWSAFKEGALKAVDEHNAAVELTRMEARLPDLLGMVAEHDARKEHAFRGEQDIKSLVASLYAPQDREAAWSRLLSDLISSDTTTYADSNRYDVAASTAKSIIKEFAGQKASTRYGRRAVNTACQQQKQRTNRKSEADCLEFTAGSISGNSISLVDSFYATSDREVDRYKVHAYPRPRSTSRGGPQESSPGVAEKAQAYRLLQYWSESRKRSNFWAQIRRGNPANGYTLSPALWNELASQAPQCFNGPTTVTAAALSTRPDLYDITPNCAHHTWVGGDFAREQINHLNLGGLDQSVWLVRNAQDNYARNHVGKESAMRLAEEALALADKNGYPDSLKEIGRSDLYLEAAHLISLLKEALADTSFVEHLSL